MPSQDGVGDARLVSAGVADRGDSTLAVRALLPCVANGPCVTPLPEIRALVLARHRIPTRGWRHCALSCPSPHLPHFPHPFPACTRPPYEADLPLLSPGPAVAPVSGTGQSG